MQTQWKRPKDTQTFPPSGQYVYCYVFGQRPFLEPSIGISTGDGIKDALAGRKVAWWLDAPELPPSIPDDEWAD